jgi:hypothetical protein
VAVKNHGRAKDFSLFDESDGRRRVEHMGGRVIDLPELDGAAMARIDRNGASFWSAIHATAGAQILAPLQRERARLWLGRCYKAFASVAQVTGEPRDASASSPAAEPDALNGSAN